MSFLYFLLLYIFSRKLNIENLKTEVKEDISLLGSGIEVSIPVIL